jgi:hypothetical protein
MPRSRRRSMDDSKKENRIGRIDDNVRSKWNATHSTATPPTIVQSSVIIPKLDGARTSSMPTLKMNSTLAGSVPTVTIQAATNRTLTSSAWPSGSNSTAVEAQAKLDTVALLPGKNQNAPKLNSTSILASPAAAIGRPLPGKNQPKPVLDEIAAASLIQFDAPWSSSMLRVSSMEVSSTVPSSSPLSVPMSVHSPPVVTFRPSSSAYCTPTSFATLTRSQPGDEQATMSSQAVLSSQTALVAQSFSTPLSSILAITSAIAIPTGQANLPAIANAEFRQRARLTPLARTLFIVFGALGQFV